MWLIRTAQRNPQGCLVMSEKPERSKICFGCCGGLRGGSSLNLACSDFHRCQIAFGSRIFEDGWMPRADFVVCSRLRCVTGSTAVEPVRHPVRSTVRLLHVKVASKLHDYQNLSIISRTLQMILVKSLDLSMVYVNGINMKYFKREIGADSSCIRLQSQCWITKKIKT